MVNSRPRPVTPGLDDSLFLRSSVPLTKEEIRCLTLSKLRLEDTHRLLDIGAGSGGLTVEAARLLGRGAVWAVERSPEALDLIAKNVNKFNLDNVTIVEGEAPASLSRVTGPFDRIVIGGSGGKTALIVSACRDLLRVGGIVVANCILLETLTELLGALNKQGFQEIGFIQAQIYRAGKLGSGNALQPLNPVFIISAKKGAHDER